MRKMVVFPKLVIVSHKNQQPRWLNPSISNQLFTLLIRHFQYQPYLDCSPLDSLVKQPSSEPTIQQKNVAIFWDLDNKPPNPIPPHEAAMKLKKTASSFGLVRHMVAYANRNSFSQVPRGIREQRSERRALNQLENKGLFKPAEPYHCGVCGRNFYNYEKLVNHFKNIHERENTKRLNQIESARGSRRVKLVAKYSMKMEKYKRASRGVLTPKVGYGLADELERAGFWVREVCNKPQAADTAMRNHIVDLMDKRRVECLLIVSDDSGFVDVLEEAKMRCVKTVVVGNACDGALKRAADSGFLWKEVMMGKAKKEAVSVLGKWKDRDILRQLEWTYDPEVEKSKCDDDHGDDDDDDESVESCVEGNGECVLMEEDESRAWWEIHSASSDSDAISSH